MNRWLLCLALISLPGMAADVVIKPSAPSTTRSGYDRGVSLKAQITDLTLGDAVYLGLRNNPAIRSAYLQRVAQKFDLRVAEDVFNPKLTLNSSYRSTRGSVDNARNANVTPSSSLLGEYGTRLSMSWTQQLNNADRAGRYRSDGLDLAIIQPLLRGAGWDATTAPLRLSRLAEQANRLNLKATVAQTISQIIATYRELLRAQEQLSIVQDALKRSGTLLEVNRALIGAGRMAEFEIVQTEADIATQQLGVEEAQNQLDTNRLALLRLLALDLSTPIRATEALEARPMQIDKRQAFNLAQTQQPEYLAALLGSQQADLNLVIAKDSGRWQVDLVAGANQIRDTYNNDAGSSNNRTWDSYAGVQVQIPIGDISTRQAEVRARVNVEDQQVRITDARQELERSVNDVVRDLGTRWRQYEIAQRAVELSRRKIEIEREKLSAGRSTNFQVLSFETDLRNAENAQLNALIAYLNAQTQLDLTLGMTLESWEIALNDY
ncbi:MULTISPECIES: TolC family protein [Pseudomonas]|jgi:outer membrane protein TolC|uniref:Outer membrane protein TolC n=2 Tax=Pseudomonas TaxID=286 RepID=A0A5C5NKS8_9PSED|nr:MULTISPECIES: TolC family protein [Pseudomonas]OXS20008.1 TolC family protein [Pseudomonas fluorescens]KAF6689814.1 TolC family protein [Pseudomonas sp. EKM23D]MBI6603190.1 TolC family protein [Pseudomonas sp. S4_EA_1b]MBI6625630.1 TolC family protein [Pseudomonas rhodesiae]MBX4134417.1 TolC family protein [Pseudomonas sp. S5F11]